MQALTRAHNGFFGTFFGFFEGVKPELAGLNLLLLYVGAEWNRSNKQAFEDKRIELQGKVDKLERTNRRLAAEVASLTGSLAAERASRAGWLPWWLSRGNRGDRGNARTTAASGRTSIPANAPSTGF